MYKIREVAIAMSPILRTKIYQENQELQILARQIKSIALRALDLEHAAESPCREWVKKFRDAPLSDEASLLAKLFIQKYKKLSGQ